MGAHDQSPRKAPSAALPQRAAMRPRSLTTPWLMDDVRDALASTGDRRSPDKARRRDLRMLFGV